MLRDKEPRNDERHAVWHHCHRVSENMRDIVVVSLRVRRDKATALAERGVGIFSSKLVIDAPVLDDHCLPSNAGTHNARIPGGCVQRR